MRNQVIVRKEIAKEIENDGKMVGFDIEVIERTVILIQGLSIEKTFSFNVKLMGQGGKLNKPALYYHPP